MDMYIGIVSKLIIGAIGVFILLRLISKKAMSELTPFDLIYIVLLGAIVEESIYDDKVNVLHVLFAIMVWGLFVYLIEKTLQSTEKLSSLIQGEPSILIDRGQLNMKELNRNYIDMEQLRSMLRQNDIYSIHDVYYAILEVNGTLTVISKEESIIPSALLIEFGSIKTQTLNSIQKDETWLISELEMLGYYNIDEIIYCEYDQKKELLMVETYENTIHEKIFIDD